MTVQRGLKLLQSEYNGQKFFWESESESGGRNLCIYKLPNSSRRTIKDLGGIPQTFTVKAIIVGENYLEESERFRNKLIEGGRGDLIIPNFGIHKVYLSTYSRDTSQSQIGQHDFSLTFELEEMTGLFVEDYATEQDVYNSYLEANEALSDAFADVWEDPSTNANRLTAIEDTKSYYQIMKEAFKDVNGVVNQIDSAVAVISSSISTAEIYADLLVSEGVFAFVASVVGLGSSYSKIVDLIDFGKNLPNRLSDLGRESVDAFSNQVDALFDFDVPLWRENFCSEWNERNDNRKQFVATIRSSAFIALLNDIPNIEFQTIDELKAIQIQLQEFFDSVINDKDGDVVSNQNFQEKLLTLKQNAFSYMEEIEQTVFYVSEVDVFECPPNILSQRLYGEQSREVIIQRADILKELNDGKQIFDGKTTVLKEND